MAFLKWHILLLEVLSIFVIVTLESVPLGSGGCFDGRASPSYCSNDSVSCSCQASIIIWRLLQHFKCDFENEFMIV